MKVFVLQHVHKNSSKGEDVKLIGVYSTEDKARTAIGRVAGSAGFRDVPDGFHIDCYEVDVAHWADGYITVP
jgi:hypothetical protein